MKKKFFSLIHGDDVQVAPGTKVIPSKEYDTMLDAKGVVEKVQKDAVLFKEEVAIECEKLKEQAQKDGYEAGFQEWAEHIEKFQNEINALRKEYSKLLAPVALKATQKIVGKAFEMSDDLIYNIVNNALKPVLQHKKVTIYVNKDDLEALERNREKLRNVFESIETLSIREREDITQGGCVIETEGGIINARLENQWAVLERAFEQLLKSVSDDTKSEPKDKETLQETQ
ncbi:MAG: HrpE/YscL family type III secretion apparatus protein [Chlamydiota bacterium]|nr:HrpE/YscL family type III secretion apparatus protein [Chlamydiota bacterium]